MLSGLFKLALFNNTKKLLASIVSIDDFIGSIAGERENDINPALAKHIASSLNNLDLGSINFKRYSFDVSIETETKKTHQRYCQMNLSKKKSCELGDILLVIDYIFDDYIEHKMKVINGVALVIETKKERTVAKWGLSAAQLYLMTQWPQFSYDKKTDWNLNVFSDNFGFYLFILDPTFPENEKSSILSASMIKYYLGINKQLLLNEIDNKVSFNTGLIRREAYGPIMVPLTMGDFLFQSLYLKFGSPSINIRELLTRFFPKIEEAEDCIVETKNTQSFILDTNLSQTQLIDTNGKPISYSISDDNDGDLYIIRTKVIMKRTD